MPLAALVRNDEISVDSQRTVSSHVACLRDCDLVSGRIEGRQVVYRLRHAPLLEVLGAAQRLLEATGHVVLLCPTYDEPAAEQLQPKQGR